MSPGETGPVLVVGASLAGTTVAGQLREVGFPGEITLLGAEDVLPYERPALSKTYLTGQVDAAALLVHDAAFYADHGIALRLGEPATGLDTDRQLVRLASGEQLPYGTLVIATGASNVRPRIPGIDLAGVHQLRTLADADALRAALTDGARTAVTVGRGFIGCEIAATLAGLGVAVAAVDGGPGPLWGPLGPELSAVARSWHEQHGVRVLTDQRVTALLPDCTGSAVRGVQLGSGERLPADLVVVGVGARPNTSWLLDAPVHLAAGAIDVDRDGRTNLPGVYAAGDATATWDATTGTHRRHEHWAAAIAQGRRVARAVAGSDQEPLEPPYFWSDQYDKTLQYSGKHDADSSLVLRGDPTGSEQPLTGFFLHGGTVSAVVAVNDGKHFRRAQRLIELTVSPADLTDPSVDLRHLARPTPAASVLSTDCARAGAPSPHTTGSATPWQDRPSPCPPVVHDLWQPLHPSGQEVPSRVLRPPRPAPSSATRRLDCRPGSGPCSTTCWLVAGRQNMFVDKVRGKQASRPALDDVVLGRSPEHLIETVQDSSSAAWPSAVHGSVATCTPDGD